MSMLMALGGPPHGAFGARAAGAQAMGQVPGDAELILMPERRCFIAD